MAFFSQKVIVAIIVVTWHDNKQIMNHLCHYKSTRWTWKCFLQNLFESCYIIVELERWCMLLFSTQTRQHLLFFRQILISWTKKKFFPRYIKRALRNIEFFLLSACKKEKHRKRYLASRSNMLLSMYFFKNDKLQRRLLPSTLNIMIILLFFSERCINCLQFTSRTFLRWNISSRGWWHCLLKVEQEYIARKVHQKVLTPPFHSLSHTPVCIFFSRLLSQK